MAATFDHRRLFRGTIKTHDNDLMSRVIVTIKVDCFALILPGSCLTFPLFYPSSRATGWFMCVPRVICYIFFPVTVVFIVTVIITNVHFLFLYYIIDVASMLSHHLHDAALDPYFTAWSGLRSLLKKARERALAVAAAVALAAFVGANIMNL